MDYLRRLFHRSQDRQRPVTLPSSNIINLPVEILLCIFELLRPTSAIAFSLCNKQLRRVFETQDFISIFLSTENKLTLLQLLARDLPNQIVCVPCERLHAMENLYRYNSTTYSCDRRTALYESLRFPACVSRDRRENLVISKLFGIAAFKMAMKRYHQQPECTTLLKMMSTKTALSMQSGNYVWQFTEECCIVQGHLIQRRQSVYISRKGVALGTMTSFMDDPPCERVCPHVKFEPSAYHAGSGVQRCRDCRTQYRVDFKDYDGHGVAMFITRWKDLGTGPESEMWNQYAFRGVAYLGSLFLNHVSDEASMEDLGEPPLHGEDLSSAFEPEQDYRIDSILLEPRNRSDLFWIQAYGYN